MVSKVAVIALVAIVAVPIMLGYAMNINEVTVTDYKETGEAVNVTPLYQNGVGYSYVMADIYQLNTNFTQGINVIPGTGGSKIFPEYQKVSSTKSSLPNYVSYVYPAGGFPSEPDNSFDVFDYFYFQSNFDTSAPYTESLTVNISDATDFRSWTIPRFHSLYYDSSSKVANVTYFDSSTGVILAWQIPATEGGYKFEFNAPGAYSSTGYMAFSLKNDHPQYVDLSAGYRLTGMPSMLDDTVLNDSILSSNGVKLDLPEYPNSVLLTMDLSTIADASYDLIYTLKGYGSFDEYYTLRKTTDGSGIHWGLYKGRPLYGLNIIADLYYDSSRLSNTYQIYIDNTGIEFRYVGNWPTVFGSANAYQVYRYDRDYQYYIGGVRDIVFWNNTPLMRVDASEYRAFEYPLIEDQTYNPADFKTNPATTLSGNVIYGDSLIFGSNTYTVTDGNITLGTHKIPVKGMVLDSIPNGNGSYDNRINGTKVSESINPATITFNGKWSADITTISQESYTYNKTEWVAGSFAWDGIDHNFLMVGLITCLGVFIALGVYGRRTGARVLPLMIVCGGAALLFFVML